MLLGHSKCRAFVNWFITTALFQKIVISKEHHFEIGYENNLKKTLYRK